VHRVGIRKERNQTALATGLPDHPDGILERGDPPLIGGKNDSADMVDAALCHEERFLGFLDLVNLNNHPGMMIRSTVGT